MTQALNYSAQIAKDGHIPQPKNIDLNILKKGTKVEVFVLVKDKRKQPINPLSPEQLYQSAKRRAEVLTQLGYSRDMAAQRLRELMEEIRQDAMEKGMAIDEDQIRE